VDSILQHLKGTSWIMAGILYGAGLRLMECARLRIKDVEFNRDRITIRSGKGRKDRVTMLPRTVKGPLAAHLEDVRRQHASDLRHGLGSVKLPFAIARKYPSAK
jgi:integrase